MTRRSSIAFVLVRLDLGRERALLLRENDKWRDWSFVGGHVEPGEEGDWTKTAIRETEEEMLPLQHLKHFLIEELPVKTITWQAASRSASGVLTDYAVRCYLLTFVHSPEAMLSQLSDGRFILAGESWLRSHPPDVGDTVVRTLSHLGEGLGALPLSWPDVVNAPSKLVQSSTASGLPSADFQL